MTLRNMMALAILFALGCSTAQRLPSAARGPETLFRKPGFEVITSEELTRNFDQLVFASDFHGMLEEATNILRANDILSDDSNNESWAWRKNIKPTLLVITGDLINKGPDSVPLLLRFKELAEGASKVKSRTVLLLGNHETDFLADPKNECHKEFLKSAEGIDGIQKGDKLSCKDIHKSFVGDFMRNFKVGALIGEVFFVHSGYLSTKGLDLESDTEALSHGRQTIARASEQFSEGNYYELNHPGRSMISEHDWYEKQGEQTFMVLNAMGVRGMMVGHEPGLLDEPGKIAINKSKWMVKLDVGVNPEREDSKGMLLLCDPKTYLTDFSACVQSDEKGKHRPLVKAKM